MNPQEITANYIITTAEFNELLEKTVKDFQEQSKKQKIEQYQLTAITFSTPKNEQRERDTDVYIMDAPWEERFTVMEVLGKELWDKNHQVAAVFVCFESWVKKFDIGQTISSRPLSDYQEKEEGFCVMGQTIDLKINAAFLKINRPLNGKRIILSSPTIHPYKDSEKSNVKFSSDLLKRFYQGYFEKCANKINGEG